MGLLPKRSSMAARNSGGGCQGAHLLLFSIRACTAPCNSAPTNAGESCDNRSPCQVCSLLQDLCLPTAYDINCTSLEEHLFT